MPHVRAWSNKKSLTWSNRIQADGTLGAVGRLSVGVFSVVDLCLFEDIFVCCSVELVQALLPTSVAFDTNLDTTEDDLFSTFKINAQLNDITIVERVCTTLHAWTAQAHMIQKGAGTTLNVFDEPLTIVAPELTMPATDDLALEANGSCGFGTCLRIDGLISFGISTDLYSLTSSGNCACDDRKGEGRPRSTRLMMGDETNGRGFLFVGGCSLRRRSSSRLGSVGGRGGGWSGVVVGGRGILTDSGSSCTGHVWSR